jgi:flavin reductase (DIM6/NTAB) family NADH-FMN oxidoreductase RutF
VFGAAASFAVNILAADQEGVSRTFCQPDVDRFGLTPHRLSGLGLPLIEGAAVWLECALEAHLPGGDHTIFVGRVLTSSVFERAPLLHWRGGYQVLQAL